ncbi:TetR/AcrR family transcriptional regulator [Deinococcus sp.]|uniref:TetR/AcrR family transcriptional regulator n=1 Tax=Deinococcus sp. TaxID=47478 RepID=UPI0025F5D7CB|nr:TetR/AcrR family transcriptional regulator [Deinococcus sp.]
MVRTSNRTALLEAAVRVASREGAARLTLDAVALEAGVSKGGLLYHFASKEALLSGLLSWELGSFEAALEARCAGSPAPGAYLRAYLELSLEALSFRVPLGVLAAFAFEPSALADLQTRLLYWRVRACAGLDPAQALTLVLAADGAWLAALLGAPISEPQAQSLRAQLDALISSEVPA